MLKNFVKLFQESFNSIVYHTPKDKLNNLEIEKIKQNGLIHFCKSENIKDILREGIKSGCHEPMKRAEKGYTWYYIYEPETFEEKKKIIHSKGERKNYNAYVIIKGLTEKQINQLRIRRKVDNAIIYPGSMKTEIIEAHIMNKR